MDDFAARITTWLMDRAQAIADAAKARGVPLTVDVAVPVVEHNEADQSTTARTTSRTVSAMLSPVDRAALTEGIADLLGSDGRALVSEMHDRFGEGAKVRPTWLYGFFPKHLTDSESEYSPFGDAPPEALLVLALAAYMARLLELDAPAVDLASIIHEMTSEARRAIRRRG